MGSLGLLLLNGAIKGKDAVAAATKAGAASGASSGVGAPAGESAPAGDAVAPKDYVILSPALGFPQLVDETSRQLTVILLSKNQYANGVSYLNAMRWVKMSVARKVIEGEPLPQDALSTVPGVFVSQQALALSDYRDKVKKGWFLFDQGGDARTEIRGRLSAKMLSIYEKKGFNSLIILRIRINESVFMDGENKVRELYSLWAPGQSELVREILKGLTPSNYPDCPMAPDKTVKTFRRRRYMGKGEWKEDMGNQDLVTLHPVLIGAPSGYLNLAHVTDMHIARRWDHMASKIWDSEASEEAKKTARTMNKVNSNYESVCRDILDRNLTNGAAPIHAVIQTGDLIDYCRGDNKEGGKAYSDKRFEFNTNWMLYYQLLVNNYELPTYTVLGNHDWHLSQYAPYPVFGVIRNFGTLALIGLFLNATAALSALIFKGISDAGNSALAGIVATMFIMLFMWFLIECCMVYWWMFGGSVDFTNWGFGYVTLAGFLFGLVHALLNLFSFITPEHQFMNAMIIANSIWLALVITVAIGGDWTKAFGMTYVVDQLQPRESFKDKDKAVKAEAIEEFYDENIHDMDLFGPQSLFYLDEDSVTWYAFVINPFMDYAFDYQNMHLAMFDWGEHEGIELPPIAEDALSDGQLDLLKSWGASATERGRGQKDQGKSVRPVIGSHFAVFAQNLKAKLDRLSEGVEWDDRELQIGIIGENRLELIKMMDSLKDGNAPPVALGGHTHIYGVFQTEVKQVQVVGSEDSPSYEMKHVVSFINSEAEGGDTRHREVKGFRQEDSVYAITISAGPPGDAKMEETGVTEKRPPGYRRIFFKDNGEIGTLDELDIPEPAVSA